MVKEGDPIPENFDRQKPHSARINQAIQQDPNLMLRDIHKVLVGDGYGSRGLIEDVKKNTNFRYSRIGLDEAVEKNTDFRKNREEERRVQVKIAKITGAVGSGGGITWAVFQEKIAAFFAALFN